MPSNTNEQRPTSKPLAGRSSMCAASTSSDLPQAVQDEAREGGLDELYALHRADGEQVALVGDRLLAFNLARENDLHPGQRPLSVG